MFSPREALTAIKRIYRKPELAPEAIQVILYQNPTDITNVSTRWINGKIRKNLASGTIPGEYIRYANGFATNILKQRTAALRLCAVEDLYYSLLKEIGIDLYTKREDSYKILSFEFPPVTEIYGGPHVITLDDIECSGNALVLRIANFKEGDK